MTYEEANWSRLSPRRRDAVNALRKARGLPPIPPPAVDLYEPPKPSVAPAAAPDYSELMREYRAATARFDAALRNGAEGFQIKGGRVEGLEVVNLPNSLGYEGIAEGRRGAVQVTEGFSIRR